MSISSARADEKAHENALDRKFAQGLLSPEERYGRFYEELVETIRSCPALLAITGPVDTLTLRPGQTLALSDGSGAEAGKYFTFDLQAGRGNAADGGGVLSGDAGKHGAGNHRPDRPVPSVV
ncbi:MAG: hypothetical protein RQ847_11575 [Wenzhouxiangellaceae bacterium]|nr:hypothetical protein [Wenzhouxiangellaceae bacterium]